MIHVEPLTIFFFTIPVPLLGTMPDVALWLIHSKWTKRIFFFAGGEAICAATLFFLSDLHELRFLAGLILPLFQLAFLRFAYLTFKRLQGRWPVDVAFNWRRGLFWDRFFAISVTLTGIFVPAALILSP